MSGRLPLALLLALLPLISCFPAPQSLSHPPNFLHNTFLQLRDDRIRSVHARIVKELVVPQNALSPLSRVGLAFEPCSTDMPCEGERRCAQLVDSDSGSVELTDCSAGVCFCADEEGCASDAECLEGEGCGPSGTCLSNAFIPGATDISQANASATLGLNLDPCESIADCRNPRNCVQYVDGVFGECQGANCFCVLPDLSCISISECSEGESCTKREGSSTAVCISEAALESGDVSEEEIDEITTNQPPPMPMPVMPTPAPPVTEAPATMAPTTMAPTTMAPTTMAPTTMAPTTMAPTTMAPTTMAPTTMAPATEPPTTEAPPTTTPPTEGPTTVPPATTAPSTTAADTMADSPDESSEDETVDREPPAVMPVGEGEDETVSPTEEDELGELVTESDEPDGDVISDGIGSSPAPELEDGSEGDGATDEPEDEICIGVHHLSHMTYKELVYSTHRVARVLCDKQDSCATPGHIVLYRGEAMMMRKYCTITRCVQKIMRVNSPRYSRAARVDSHTQDLRFTAFAARYESAAEERLLGAFVRIGL